MIIVSDKTFEALSSPQRALIYQILLDVQKKVGEDTGWVTSSAIAGTLGMSTALVSYHLKKLHLEGWVDKTTSGKYQLYRVRVARIEEVYEWLKGIRTSEERPKDE